MGGMLKKVQEMQENMQKMQEELANQTVTGKSGAGAVEVVLNGHYQCQKLTISPEILTEDQEILEALLAAAINDAINKVKELSQNQMANLTDGIPLPAGFKFPSI